jgi:anti-sigma factor ChrR (cupin superfamily)
VPREEILMNSDYAQRVVLKHHDLPWLEGAEPGIESRLIERADGDVAGSTAIVRCQPGATLTVPPGGVEILVLNGALSDDTGAHPAGAYLMIPPVSTMALFSEKGCTLFVKQGHLGPESAEREALDTRHSTWYPGLVPGLSVMPLMRQGTGSTLVKWAPQTYFSTHQHFGGEEIFVVSGVFSDEHGTYPEGTWIRSPHMSRHTPFSVEGCTIFVKTGHLMRGALTP